MRSGAGVGWQRRSRVATSLVAALGAACGVNGGRGDLAAPSAIIVTPAPDGPKLVSAPDPTVSAEPVAPLELAIDSQRICIRASGRVHCSTSLAPETALTAPTPLEGIDDAVSLALGAVFGCAATRGGKVLCFGDNTYGQLGAQLRAERSDKAVVVSGLDGAKRVSASDGQACAVLADDTVRCWGRNDTGQTGGATYYVPAARELVEADVVGGVSDATSVAPGGWTTCASKRGHGVMCWGRAPFGDDAMTYGRKNIRPTAIPELADFEDVSASGGAFCGIERGEVKCWGELYSLFAGEKARSGKLVSAGVNRARKVRGAQSHACAILTDGRVTCWGIASYGALGRGDTTASDPQTPEAVHDLPPAIDIAVGGASSCAITGAREIYCWGSWPHAGGAMRKELLPVKMRID
jgi:alpha-tubulin suppressor-like RCC1 family protein